MLDLAREAQLEVRAPSASSATEPGELLASAACRVRGDVWVVLSPADPVDVRLDVLAAALRTYRGDWLEQRWLPPAVRDRLDT